MKRINKKKVSIAIILVVIIVGIIIGLIVYNLGRQEDMSIQREEQNVNTQNVLIGSIENNTENNNVSTEPNTQQIQGDEETLENARIKLTVNGNEEVFVSLDDNQASRDFLEMLPLTLTFEDFNSTEKIATLPQVELVKDKGYDVLYLTDNVDEFCFQMMRDYKEKPFKSVAQGDLDIESEEEKKELEKTNEENKDLLTAIKDALGDKVVDVKVSSRLKSHPVCLVSSEGLSFEMEKVLNQMPEGNDIKAGRILEINPNHDIFNAMKKVYENNKDKIGDYASILYDQALLIEGFSIENPVEFSNKICDLMIELNK